MQRLSGVGGAGGSLPWLVDNSATKLNAAQNKYLQVSSSIFGDDDHREAIRAQRGRQRFEELERQKAQILEARRLEKAEEDRLDAAMALPQQPVVVSETAATVNGKGSVYGGYSNYGGGGGYGDYGGGSYAGGSYGGGYDAGYGGRSDYGAGGYVPSTYSDGYSQGRRNTRLHANMMSDSHETYRAEREKQHREELQWQVQMKKQFEEERKRKEELEDKLYEESVRRQQERMTQEYEAEKEKRRRKEEEMTRRREAQLKHMEAVQQHAEEERKRKQEQARRLADLQSDPGTLPPKVDTGRDARVIKPYDPNKRQLMTDEEFGFNTKNSDSTSQATQKPNKANEKHLRTNEEFGFNALKTDSTFQAAQRPNRFFENPNTPLKLARNSDDRKRPKPLSPVAEPPGANKGATLGAPRVLRKQVPSRPRTQLGLGLGGPSNPAFPAAAPQPSLSDSQAPVVSIPVPVLPPRIVESKEMQADPPAPSSNTQVQTHAPHTAETGVQSTPALDDWLQKRPPKGTAPSQVARGKPFDWKIHIQEPTEEQRKQMEQMSQQEIKEFQEKNHDLMSQLTAMKTNLKSANGTRTLPGGGGDGRQSETIPSGKGGDVDYMRVETARPPPAIQGRDPPPDQPIDWPESNFNPNDTSGTILKKFLEKKRVREGGPL